MLSQFPIYVDLPVADQARASGWYEDRLGLVPLMEFQGGLLYLSGGIPFYMYETVNAGSAKSTAASWIVDDLAAVMEALRNHGVEFEDYDGRDGGPTTVSGVAAGQDGAAAAWFRDCEGNILSLIQLPRGMSLPGTALPS